MNYKAYTLFGRLIGLPLIRESLSFTAPRILIPIILTGLIVLLVGGNWILGGLLGWFLGITLVCWTAGINGRRDKYKVSAPPGRSGRVDL